MSGCQLCFIGSLKIAKFPRTNGDLTKSIHMILCQEECIFVDLLQIKDKFHCQESIIIHGVSAYERA